MPKHPLLSILSHPNATEEMAEKAFLQAHQNAKKYGNRFDDSAAIAAGSRAFSKRLFDKYIDHPELSGHLTSSRHFNNWVDKVGIDNALSHPNKNVTTQIANWHPGFNDWVDKVGFEEALNHPNESVATAATYHPKYSKWLDTGGVNSLLDRPIQHRWFINNAVSHPNFHQWVNKVGIERALNHPEFAVVKETTNNPNFKNWVRENPEKALKHHNSDVIGRATWILYHDKDSVI